MKGVGSGMKGVGSRMSWGGGGGEIRDQGQKILFEHRNLIKFTCQY